MGKRETLTGIFLPAIFIMTLLPEIIYIFSAINFDFIRSTFYIAMYIMLVVWFSLFFMKLTEARYFYRLHKKNIDSCQTIVMKPDKTLYTCIISLSLIFIFPYLNIIITNSFENPVNPIMIIIGWRFILLESINFFDDIFLVYTIFADEYFVYKGQKRSYQEVLSYEIQKTFLIKTEQVVLFLKGDKKIKLKDRLIYNLDLNFIECSLRQHDIKKKRSG